MRESAKWLLQALEHNPMTVEQVEADIGGRIYRVRRAERRPW